MANGFNEVEEAEANYFAMCLLMPVEMLRKEVKMMGGLDIEDDEAMRTLAKKFGVSVTLMALRIGQLRQASPRRLSVV